MIELQFLGRSADGTELLFTSEQGERYRTLLSDDLLNAVTRPVNLEVRDQQALPPLAPRDIQALLREGNSPQQIFEQSGTPIDRINRYSAPVIAEINRAIQTATRTRIGTEVDAPTMGDLVIDRLADRNVDTENLNWSASKQPDSNWEVTVVFIENDIEQAARWGISETGSTLVALDDEAKRLTEDVRTSLETVRALFPPASLPPVEFIDHGDADLLQRQEELVEKLNSARGRRQPLLQEIDGLQDEDDSAPETGKLKEPEEETVAVRALAPVKNVDRSPTGPKASQPEPRSTPKESTSKRRQRRPVPSWDEIVFGSRND